MSSPEGERSPKRRRVSYSASPSPTVAQTKNLHAQPQTPLSDRLSPQQTLPGLGTQASLTTGKGGVTFPTPPSTAGFHSHMLGRGGSSERGGGESEQQTPVAVEGEDAPKMDADADEDQAMADSPQVEGQQMDKKHRRTDHERQRSEDARPAIPLYKLTSEPLAPSAVPLASNLLSLYDLVDLQATVARRDPKTGEKINVLRKHYAGKVKQLGLEGKEKPLKKPDELIGLVDPQWSTILQDGKSLWQEQRSDALLETEDDTEIALSKLDAALGGMKAGQLPPTEHTEWTKELGLDDMAAAPNVASAKPLPASANAKAPPNAAALLAKTAPATSTRNSAPASPSRGAARPERSGRKRRYDESSYEGYDPEDGYSTGGVDDTGARGGGGGAKRQKRKDVPTSSAANSPPFHSASAGGSIIGVQSS